MIPAGDGADAIVFRDVSKFYGEVLGINRVHLTVPKGITSLVGPNGSGKTTLMNLMTGLIQPSQGTIHVLGFRSNDPERLFRRLGYCTQFDSFPKGFTGFEFVYSYLRVHGHTHAVAREMTDEAIETVGLTQAAKRKIGAYSKGMRQRIKLAQAIAHKPKVLVLDEPLNGLDPMARAEIIALFQRLAGEGMHIVISSHILHEVDLISDQVVLLNEGYIVAEGDIRGVRSEVKGHPMRILVRCSHPKLLAAKVFEFDSAVEAQIVEEGKGVVISTLDAKHFHLQFNRWVLEHGIRVEAVAPADEDVQSVYQYLIGSEEEKI